jgi:hypothetical protein
MLVPVSLLVFTALLLLASCSVDGPPTSSKTEASPLEHIAGADSALQRFSDALVADDSLALTSLTGEQFTLIEDGHTLDLDATLAALRAEAAQGQVSRTLGKITTHLKGRVAWSHYHVTGETPAAGAGKAAARAFRRVETAVLSRGNDDRWQVVLMSSTVEPPAN